MAAYFKYISALLVCTGVLFAGCFPVAPSPAVRDGASVYSPGFEEFKQGRSRYNEKRYKEAITHFEKAVQSEPQNSIYPNWLGWTYILNNQPEKALIYLKKSNNSKPRASNYKGLGRIYLRKGDCEQAVSCYRQWAELAPEDWDAYYSTGIAYFRLEKYDEALKQFKRANSKKKTQAAYIGIGDVYVMLEKYTDAVNMYKQAAECAPDNPSTYIMIGGTYFRMKKYQDAVSYYEKACSIKETPAALIGMGRSYDMLDNIEKADEKFRQALNSESEAVSRAVRISYAGMYLRRKDYKKAHSILGDTPYMGVEIKAEPRGIKIVRVVPGGPTDIAGLQKGDLIVKFNNKSTVGVNTQDFVRKMINASPYGSTVPVTFQRDGAVMDKNVLIGITPDMKPIKQASE